MSTTVRMYLGRGGLIKVLSTPVEIKGIRVIRQAGVFVVDLIGALALEVAQDLHRDGLTVSNPDDKEKDGE